MTLFLAILVGMVLVCIMGGILVGAIFWLINHFDDGYRNPRHLALGLGKAMVALVLLAAIAAFGTSLLPPSDRAKHCGPGTTYQSKFNAATKTTQWWCEGR